MEHGQRESGGNGVHLDRTVARAVVKKLVSLQGDRTDAEMGSLLGVSRVQWSHLRANRRGMSYACMKRAAVAFPDVLPIVLRDLSREEAAS
jgi:hypothetical protein